MTKERLYLYDTTLRDGQQTQGVSFSTPEKVEIAGLLDELGVDYIEGGWPGANPTDSAFFDAAPRTRARLTAFGMTKRAGRSAENDDVLAAVMNAAPAAVCLVGKTHDYHVEAALGITLEENRENIAQIGRAHGRLRGARRCSMPSISSTAGRQPRLRAGLPARGIRGRRALDRAVRHQWRHAAGARSGGGVAGHRRRHPRRPAGHPHPQRHRNGGRRRRWPPSTRARGRCRARSTGWASAAATPT